MRTRSSKQSKATQDPSVRSATTPGLPVELITNILSHFFAPVKPATPTSDRYPLRGVTNVLLVSRAFHELALPFVLRTITITRPEDYATFFGQQTGIFAGAHGAEKWKHVQRLSPAANVYPPIQSPYIGGDRLIIDLSIPEGHQVREVCVLEKLSDFDPCELDQVSSGWIARPGAKDLVRQQQNDPDRRSGVFATIEHLFDTQTRVPPFDWTFFIEVSIGSQPDFREHLYLLPRSVSAEAEECSAATEQTSARTNVEKAVDGWILQEIRNQLKDQQLAFIHDLLSAMSPAIIHDHDPPGLRLPRTYERATPPIKRRTGTGDGTLFLHWGYSTMTWPSNGDSAERGEWDMHDWAHALGCPHVHAVGYPSEDLEIYVEDVKYFNSPLYHPTTPKFVQRWTWDGKDGQTYELDLTDLSTKPAPSL